MVGELEADVLETPPEIKRQIIDAGGSAGNSLVVVIGAARLLQAGLSRGPYGSDAVQRRGNAIGSPLIEDGLHLEWRFVCGKGRAHRE